MTNAVVKVGGSLYDLPDLAFRMHTFLAGLRAPILIVPGGGATANAIRQIDRLHQVGHEAAHWLALRACSVNGHFLSHLLDHVPVVSDVVNVPDLAIVDLFAFAAADESQPDRWPHHWEVTSDSMAVRVANVARARELILLKSTGHTGTDDWSHAVNEGLVDAYFPHAVARTPGLRVRAINFRESSSAAI